MLCPHCRESTMDAGRCRTCGASASWPVAVTDVEPVDTTGLPPGATFGSTATSGPVLPGSGLTDMPTGDAHAGAPAAARAAGAAPVGPLRVGQSFSPRYHVIKLLGAGGMGAVYQAWDAELNVAVALKVIRTDRRRASPEAEKRFKTELLLARQVTHKNVVRIHDLGEIDGIKYITMPYIQGEDLATVLRREGRMPAAAALPIARQIAAGLEAAHEAGVVHRDLKPANIMISAPPEGVHAEIMDFGISVSSGDARAGDVLGTLEYMAPEQGRGDAIDARADIYALGLILYELLSGPRPAPEDRFEAMQRRCRDGLVPIRQLEPAVPEPLAAVVTRCLEIDPAARYQTTSEVCAALAALDGEGHLIPQSPLLTRRLMAALATLVALLVGGTYFLGQRAAQPEVQPDPVSVVIADFENQTSDPAFDRTLEPMVRRALEGAGFISAYDRSGVIRTLGIEPPERMDETAARELAVKQGLGVVLAGSIAPDGRGFRVALRAAQTVSGNVVASVQRTVANRDQVLEAATRLVADVRSALGDRTSPSDQMFAMTSLSATSLDVVRLYAASQEAASNNQFDRAREHMLKAVELDPAFGIGYQLLAVVSRNTGDLQGADRYANEALRYLDGMTERERYSTRGFYYRVTGDYQQCVREYSEMIARYAADVVGHNQLALCLSKLRDMRRAMQEVRQIVELLPNHTLFRDNLALYANYAGDFAAAEREARAIETPDMYATLALAFAQLGQGQLRQAGDTYGQLAELGPLAASFAASGLGDLAIVEGRYTDAVQRLGQGAAADLLAKRPDRAAAKFAALAHAELKRGRPVAAQSAAESALANSQAVGIRFLAARTLIETGDVEAARGVMTKLAAELQEEPQAYARLLEAELALRDGDAREAVALATDANARLDTWIGHLVLGRAYLALEAFVQADSEFDRCLTRRGEALSLFLDEEPTYGYLPEVYYYQGRVREALRTAGYADTYRTYLALRDAAGEDPLLPEVRQRLGAAAP